MDYDTSLNSFSPGGGNITELPNANLLLCAGSLNRIFEVTRNKEVVWDASLLMNLKNDPTWKPFPQYRCSWLPRIKEYYFVPAISEVSTSGTLNLELTNTGTEEDLFTIEVLREGKSIYKNKTKPVSANQSLEQSIPLKEPAKGLVVRIHSEIGKETVELSYKR